MLEVDSLKSAVKRLEKMQKKDKKSNAKWADELQHYLTTIDELNGIQSTLSNALHQHSSNEYIPSSSTNGTSEAPKHYLDLQTELDFRLQELQSSISALEKDANDPKNQAIFEEQKRLFSLFYTDADVFEQIYSEKK
ncbi:hypothetical protein K501DRAFT_88096 [Backusella circina FSU 941]|nr:hypothetical protein K501DRAFT_88096 [Backusella circina FSU 941]